MNAREEGLEGTFWIVCTVANLPVTLHKEKGQWELSDHWSWEDQTQNRIVEVRMCGENLESGEYMSFEDFDSEGAEKW